MITESLSGASSAAADGIKQSSVSAEFVSFLCKLNTESSIVRTCSCDYGNTACNRINSKLDLDVNAILQPVILYEASDGSFHPMSNDPAHPSTFTAAGGGIVLYPTSYTGELLAPAYQKFIAVVDGPGVAVSNINSGEYYNTPIDGKRYAIPFAPTTTGTYTIYYSAVDYSGVVTAQRFYVTVE